jgi:hypothetical protein
MARKTTIPVIFALAIIGAMTGSMIDARPAQAFCIDNKTAYPLRVHLENYNPLGKFAEVFNPGDRTCCSWFNQRCNPTRTRNGMLIFSVRTKQKAAKKMYCASGWNRQVFATADGDIVITENGGSLGGLRCDSRDLLRRPVTQQTYLRQLKKRGMPSRIIVPPPPEG